jgi:protein-S-isoprenylcysteine O-methyltransferase Ste14
LIQVVISTLLQASILFVAAGRLDWVAAWAYIAAGLGILAINLLVVLPRNPEMVAERGRTNGDTKSWDRTLTRLALIPTLGTLIVAGLDARYGWSPRLPVGLHIAGLVLYVLGQGLFSWAMASNKFFATTVRIQVDRGHTVAAGGPYRLVRHPGYVGYITAWLATPLALGSLWAFTAAGLIACLLIVRTALEDRTLLEELDGYQEYAARVRHRLLPGIW